MKLVVLDYRNPAQKFPPVDKALTEPDGLLAMGGCLSIQRLIKAYSHGTFPWYNEGEPILWWSPDPRWVLFPEQLHISHSLQKVLRQQRFAVTFDQAFAAVIDGCARPRDGFSGTWISADIRKAYADLFTAGFAHSAEAWQNGQLVGGLYGVALGQVFFGESMFHTVTDASKAAFAVLVGHLKAWGYQLIDCQVHSKHLASLGAQPLPRHEFVTLLARFCDRPPLPTAWQI